MMYSVREAIDIAYNNGKVIGGCWGADTQEPHAGKVDVVVALIGAADLEDANLILWAYGNGVQDGTAAAVRSGRNGAR